MPGPKILKAEADRYLKDHLVSIQASEQQIRVNLLPRLDAESLKQLVASEVWPRN